MAKSLAQKLAPFGADVITPRPHYDPGALRLRQSMYTVATLPLSCGRAALDELERI